LNIACGWGFAAVGFGLGLLVVLEDYRVGKWALLTHRPISRGRIFLGKILAATVLYLVATGVPLAGVTAWAAWVAAGPFDWRMVLPRLVQVLAGMCWIAAGMLVAARRARWIGSRLFPAVAALLICADAQLGETNTLAIVGMLLAGVVGLAIPARSAFVAAGDFESQPWIGRLLQTLAVAAGVGMVLLCATAIGFELADLATQQNTGYSYYSLDEKGKVYRIDSGMGTAELEWTGGRLVPTKVGVSQAKGNAMLADGRARGYPDRSLFSQSRYVQFIHPDNGRSWYWLPRSRTIEAYDAFHRHRVASLGPGGIRDGSQPPEAFAEPIEFTNWGVDFSEQTVWWIVPPGKPKVMFTVPAGQQIRAVGIISPADDHSPGNRIWEPQICLAVFTGSELQIVRAGKALARVALRRHPEDKIVNYEIAERPDGGFAIYVGLDNLLIEVGPDGRDVSQTVLPPLPESADRAEALHDAVTVAMVPPAGVWAAAMRARAPVGWRMAAGSAGIAGFAGMLGWLRMRRHAGNTFNRWWWTAMCGLCGVGGVLLLVCMRSAIVRMPCPNCGRKRLVAREQCEHCGAPFPPPVLTGVEVFESQHVMEVGT
jgi:predicted RNA-binding Zn-ribbon protein involved in translation (DUF1610 family)